MINGEKVTGGVTKRQTQNQVSDKKTVLDGMGLKKQIGKLIPKT